MSAWLGMSQGLGSGASHGDLPKTQGLGRGVSDSETRSQAEVRWASLTAEERRARLMERQGVDARGDLPALSPLLEGEARAVVRPGPRGGGS